ERIVRIDVADGPATAVEIDERRHDFASDGAIDPHREIVECEKANFRQRRRLRRERSARVAIDASRDERRDRVVGRQRRARDALEQCLHLRMHAHRSSHRSYLTAASMAFSRSTKNGAHFMMRVSCRSISGRTFVRYACHSASADMAARQRSRWSRLSYAHMCTIMLRPPTSVK